MKKLILSVFVFLFSTLSVFAKDMRFVVVDGVYFNSLNKQSVNRFNNLIENINKQENVDFVVFTGNNIYKPDKNTYIQFLKKAKKLHSPYYIVIGQKDVDRRKEMSKQNYMKLTSKYNWSQRRIKTPNYSFVKNGVAFVVVDGSKDVIPSSIGYYKPDVLEWLNSELNKYKNKTVVKLQHYPIVPPSNRESHYTYKSEDYLKLLETHNNVKAIYAGHFGVNNEQKVNGILHVATAEAPKYRIVDIIDYDTENPEFWSVIKE